MKKMFQLAHHKNNKNEKYTHTISNRSDWPKPKSFTAHSWQGGREKGTLGITGALYLIAQKPIAFGLGGRM